MKIARYIHPEPGYPTMAVIEMSHPLFGRDQPRSPEENLLFNMETYKKLSTPSPDALWDAQFKAVNQYLATLNQEQIYAIYDFFLRCKRHLLTVNEGTYRTVVTAISTEIIELAHRIQLLGQFLDYVQAAELPIPPSTKNIVPRPHDRAEMTFTYPEYVQLTAISLLAKMMSPIWGDFIHRIGPFIDNVNKEMFCLAMLEPLLESSRLSEVYSKLFYYLDQVVGSETRRIQSGSTNKQEVKFVQAFGGFSDIRLSKTIYAVIFVKKFANVDLLEERCDLMKYINVSINATFKARLSALRRANTHARTEQQTEGADRDNASYMEYDTRPSSTTADVPILIRVGVEMAIPGLLKKYGIAKAVFDEAVLHYQRYLVTPSLLSQAILSLMFAHAIGGAYSLRYLTMEKYYLHLVVIAQLHLAQQGSAQLAHLISCITPGMQKLEPATSVDYSITNNLTISAPYRQLERVYPIRVDGKDIQSHLRALMGWIVNHHHYYNTPDVVFNILDETIQPRGDLIEYDERIMIELCEFILTARAATEE